MVVVSPAGVVDVVLVAGVFDLVSFASGVVDVVSPAGFVYV